MNEKTLKKALEHILTTPMPIREILKRLKVTPGDKVEVKKRIRSLANQGAILRIRGARYGLPEKMNLVTGTVQGHRDGYGFVLPDDPDQEDVFLKAYNFSEVMHGDKVIARVEKEKAGGRREGRVVRILERANETVACILDQFGGGAYASPLESRISQDIYIPQDRTLNAKDGQAVLVRITVHPSKARQAMGEVIEVLGAPDDPAVEIELACSRFHIRSEFPLAALAEAEKARAPEEKEYPGREDFRQRTIVTIDGETAKDFDDAVEVSRLPEGGWRLGVHIADVSEYVKEGSALDKEAVLRGTSVYFPGTVKPMLPFQLSNEICSLNPKTPRFTLSCVMTLDEEGEVTGHELCESVISTTERMTYTDVAAIAEHDDPVACRRYKSLVPLFKDMAALAELIRNKRLGAGALDFDLPEPEVVLDMTGKPENIIRRERNLAHKLIEEFMLLANKTVARALLEKKLTILNRIHEKPDQMKVDAFLDFISAFGIRPSEKGMLSSKWLSGILKRFEGRPEEKLVTHVMLRSMKQARYSVEPRGHFALAFPHYAHFTSPIRRYPDLVIHRIIKRTLRGGPAPEGWEEVIGKTAEHCSVMERNAEEAERDIIKLKQTQYMADKVGEKFYGLISGVTSFGFFVELEEPAVEGLVRVSTIGDDYYRHDEVHHTLVGERNGRAFRLGDRVKVMVAEVSVRRRQIDFSLVSARAKAPERGGRAEAKQGRVGRRTMRRKG